MGIKLSPDVNALPASMDKGELSIYVGKTVHKVNFGQLSQYSFEKQCTQFLCENVMAYLVGEKFSVVLRFDKTGAVFYTKDKTLFKSFTFDVEFPEISRLFPMGVYEFSVGRGYENSLVYGYRVNDNKEIVLTCGKSWTMVLEPEKNKEYLALPGVGELTGYPRLELRKEGMCIVEKNHEVVYVLDGYIEFDDGFTLL